jgi:LCP family protein required for cell wall assembly
MSPFKTKKLPNKTRESSLIQSKPTPREDIFTIKKMWSFGPKFWIASLLWVLSLFFIGQIALRALQWNEQNWSETFTPKKIIEEFVTQKVQGTTNILIAGIWWKGHDGSDLTDSIMLASLDGEKNTVTLLSIPRDLYIAYPKGKWSWRINSLYDLGKRDKVWISHLADKVSEITWQTIDHYFVIDFAWFTDLIDTLWWVSIDVPEALIDREYPDNNWGYTTFSVKAWPQLFDGATALKYARSRHSTSDFDRSNRQQLIIKWIKEKATDLWIITNPGKIAEVYNSIISHLDTDLSIAKMGEIALAFSDIKSENINIVSLSDACFSITKCAPWSYLYAPSRDLFGWSAVVIPENAQPSKLSYYADIRKFVDLTFRYPLLQKSPREVVFVSDPSMKKRTQDIGMGLAKFWFPISFEKSLIISTGSIEKSHINVYWNSDLSVWIDPASTTVESLKYIEEAIPIIVVEKNEYANNSWPKIEIIIGKDWNEYFKALKSAYYIPAPPKNMTSWEVNPSNISPENTIEKGKKINTPATPKVISGEKTIAPGEWENF